MRGSGKVELHTGTLPPLPAGGGVLFRCYLLPLLLLFLIAYMGSCSGDSSYNGILQDDPPSNFCLKGWERGSENRTCLSDFRGKVVFLFFEYTRCPDVCPRTLETLSRALNLIPPEHRKRVSVLFVSLDPERDTPEYVQRYASFFGREFLGLTGNSQEIREVSKNYKVFYRRVRTGSGGGYLVDHTANLYLIPPGQDFMLVYPVMRQRPELISADIERLFQRR